MRPEESIVNAGADKENVVEEEWNIGLSQNTPLESWVRLEL